MWNNLLGKLSRQQKVINVEKNTIEMMTGIRKRTPFGELFKKFNILLFASQFLMSLLSFVLDNTEKFQIQTHSVQTQDGNVTFPC
jgi:hypothetical protein